MGYITLLDMQSQNAFQNKLGQGSKRNDWFSQCERTWLVPVLIPAEHPWCDVKLQTLCQKLIIQAPTYIYIQYMCVYIYIYIYVYVCVYIYICVYMCVCIYSIYIYVCVCVCVCVCACVCVYICAYMCVYIYISGGPLSALTCCVNARLLSAIKKYRR